MDNSQRGSNNDSSNSMSTSSGLMPNVLFREIHKNAFLKRHSSDRRAGFPRKSEKVWVVFCVHDDVEPFLEIYSDQKVALTHKPEWFASLSNVLHVSPTICGHEDEFEFAVTLSFQVVRLSAPSWESMMEWVETIRNKLRELKVLCPKENIYSKMPEQKQPLLPTRDPNSPLPLPPEGPSTLLPGVEIVHLETRNGQVANDNNDVSRHLRDGPLRSNNNHERRISKRRENPMDRNARTVSEPSQSADPLNNSNSQSESHQSVNMLEVSPSLVTTNCDLQPNRLKVKRAVSVPQPTPLSLNSPSSSNITVIEVSTSSPRENHSASECNAPNLDNSSDNEGSDDVFFAPNTQKPDGNNFSGTENSLDEAYYEHVFFSNSPAKPQTSGNSKVAVNCISVDSKTYKKPHLTSVMINPNNSSHVNSSQDGNVAGTSSSCPSNNASAKDVPTSNLTCVNISGIPEENEANGPLSPGIQSKLEKLNISGLIPRVPAKSTKLGGFKSTTSCNKDLDGKKCAENKNPQAGPSSVDQGIARITNDESSKTKNFVGVSSCAYSQVKKLPKTKVKNEGLRTEEEPSNQASSPVLPKRKSNEIVDVDPHRSKKPECLPSSSASKIQSSLIELKPPQKVGGKKPEVGNGSKEVLGSAEKNQASCEPRNEILSPGPSTSGNRVESSGRINVSKKESVGCSNDNSDAVEPIIATVQPAVGVISVEDIPLIGGHQRRRRRSSSSDATPASNIPPSRAIGGADRIRINVPLSANPSRESHRNEGESRSSSHSRNEQNFHAVSQTSRLTLREQQVLQLKKEMLHPGGVRLQLRRKDCTGSIALVDVLNGVWVAGWKQKEHPLLYNALHIGDQLISVGDVVVRSSAEAHKLIRGSTSLYIEFIIRRVPFGNVFALHRSSEGQNLGIVQEGNTAEIKEVVASGVAARQGLTSKTPSCDGLSLTTWFLTEINGRPLNLFFKDNEVKDRLNAVGKEISILVQPHDFIKQIKKQLKNLRSYKDYIVQ